MPLTKAAREAGYTLVELLMAIALLGIIILPLTAAVIGYLKNSDATADRMALSHDAQISAAYVAADVAGVGMRDYTAPPAPGGTLPFLASVQLDAAYDAGGKTCGTAATPVAKVRFLSDDWDTSGSAPVVGTDVVAYYLSAPVAGVSELHRMRCAGSTSPVSDTVLAHNVDPTTWSVTCAAPSTCDTASVPRQVTVAFTVTRPSVGGYPVSLTGQRRQT
jgi:prepilin-type N-terminal cleavage/methylation domain-containing protein